MNFQKNYLVVLFCLLCLCFSSCQSLYYLPDNKYEPVRIQEQLIFGERGSGPGKFQLIDAIICDYDGNIYVGDQQGFIHKFDQNGKFIKIIGSQGTGKGQFWGEVKGLAIDSDDRLLAVDEFNQRVNIFTLDGQFLYSFTYSEFSDPQGIAVDEYNNIYVTDAKTNFIFKFDSTGKFILKFGGAPGRQYPDMTYIDNKVVGKVDGKFKGAEGVKVNNAMVYVADEDNSRVQVFDENGNYIGKIGGDGITEGKFYNQVEGLCFTPDGLLFAVNESKEKWGSVNVYNLYDYEEAKPLLKFQGTSPMVSPDGIAFDPKNNRILVVDQGNWQIRVFELSSIESKYKY